MQGNLHHSKTNTVFSEKILRLAPSENAFVLNELKTQLSGLSELEVRKRQKQYGLNIIAREKHITTLSRLFENIKNPLVLLLGVLAIMSFLTGDMRATIVILVMIILGVVLRFVQEMRADNVAKKLKAMVSNTATVIRSGQTKEIDLKQLVPGDIIQLSAGDMIPADIRILSAKDLFLNQSTLTGEAQPVEKKPNPDLARPHTPFEFQNMAFAGSNVQSGTAMAVVVTTGQQTYFGSLSADIMGPRTLTDFDKGVNQFTWLMIRFIAVMVPIVFILNILSKHNWLDAFLFTLAIAVGLTPEMLPMIVTVNLSKGALALAKRKMIVKRLNAIQNFGAMDVLCTDKTGTITLGKITLEKHVDVHGKPNEKVLHFGYLNSYFHTGLKNLLDQAILDHREVKEFLKSKNKYQKIDEIPFDFVRKRMSVVIEDEAGMNTLICKGAVEEMLSICSHIEIDGQLIHRLPEHDKKSMEVVNELSKEGFRVIALAYKTIKNAPHDPVYTIKDETDLVLLGFLSFLDPPKETAAETLQRLHQLNVDVKILTGDNEMVSAAICKKVGIATENILTGSQITAMCDEELARVANKTSIFARLVPMDKERIIRSFQKSGHAVGFLGDGINDAPALKAADVGISVDSAVDIAKESSDIILLEQSLLILEQSVVEGRKVFGNIMKYIKMAASSNFGNVFSVLGASLFLPFLPMLPIQILTNNLLYDFSQTTIPTDKVDEDWLKQPRRWRIGNLARFILTIGPISSIFDYATFFIMIYIFKCWHNPTLFQTGWFVESLFTQTLIIHIIRTNKIPFIESMASWPLMLTSILIVVFGAWLTVSPLAHTLGLVKLPALYWPLLAVILLSYVILTQIIKTWFVRRFEERDYKTHNS